MSDGTRQASAKDSAGGAPESAVLDALSGAIGRLRFGTVLVTVHDGKVVQLDITERRRFS